MAKKKSSPKSGKRKAGGKVGDLPVTRGRGAAVKGGALTTARYAPPQDPDNVLNTLSRTTTTYLG